MRFSCFFAELEFDEDSRAAWTASRLILLLCAFCVYLALSGLEGVTFLLRSSASTFDYDAPLDSAPAFVKRTAKRIRQATNFCDNRISGGNFTCSPMRTAYSAHSSPVGTGEKLRYLSGQATPFSPLQQDFEAQQRSSGDIDLSPSNEGQMSSTIPATDLDSVSKSLKNGQSPEASISSRTPPDVQALRNPEESASATPEVDDFYTPTERDSFFDTHAVRRSRESSESEESATSQTSIFGLSVIEEQTEDGFSTIRSREHTTSWGGNRASVIDSLRSTSQRQSVDMRSMHRLSE